MLGYTRTVAVGDYAYVDILTAPGNTCYLVYILPSGRRSTAQGLGKKIADDEGRCSWAWRIGTKTKPGIGKLIITINNVNQQTYPIQIVP